MLSVEDPEQVAAWETLEAGDVARAWADVHVSSGDIGERPTSLLDW